MRAAEDSAVETCISVYVWSFFGVCAFRTGLSVWFTLFTSSRACIAISVDWVPSGSEIALFTIAVSVTVSTVSDIAVEATATEFIW